MKRIDIERGAHTRWTGHLVQITRDSQKIPVAVLFDSNRHMWHIGFGQPQHMHQLATDGQLRNVRQATYNHGGLRVGGWYETGSHELNGVKATPELIQYTGFGGGDPTGPRRHLFHTVANILTEAATTYARTAEYAAHTTAHTQRRLLREARLTKGRVKDLHWLLSKYDQEIRDIEEKKTEAAEQLARQNAQLAEILAQLT